MEAQLAAALEVALNVKSTIVRVGAVFVREQWQQYLGAC